MAAAAGQGSERLSPAAVDGIDQGTQQQRCRRSEGDAEEHPHDGAAARALGARDLQHGAAEHGDPARRRERPGRQDQQLVRPDDGSHVAAVHGVDAPGHVRRRLPRRVRAPGRHAGTGQPLLRRRRAARGIRRGGRRRSTGITRSCSRPNSKGEGCPPRRRPTKSPASTGRSSPPTASSRCRAPPAGGPVSPTPASSGW